MKPRQLFQKPMLVVLFLFVFSLSFSQVTEQWVKRYDGPGRDKAAFMVIDVKGNVYVTGESNGNFTTIKYAEDGNEVWLSTYTSPENDFGAATSLAVDASGNVYVTGISKGGGGEYDYATIKYDADGKELWVKRYDSGNGSDFASSLAVDGNGNVYVTGYSINNETGDTYVTIKYNAAGEELWVKKYGGRATFLTVDKAGNVYVTGWTWGGELFDTDYTTIKYDSDGNELWVKKYDGPGSNFEEPRYLVVDAKGNVYITGTSSNGAYQDDRDYATIKYDSNGKELWVQRYSGPGNYLDQANSLAVDASGNVYVTGISKGSGGASDDYATIKYDADGEELWVKRYNDPQNGYDAANSLAVDGAGNVYVTGSSGTFSNTDYATIKYDTAGKELWVKKYNSFSQDIAASIGVDAEGNVYVTGESFGNSTKEDYATIKYDAAGEELWVKRYNSPGNDVDEATSLTADAKGNVYVTGNNATIKYNADGNEVWVRGPDGPSINVSPTSLVVDAAGNVYVTGAGDGVSLDGSIYVTIKYDANGKEQWVKTYRGYGYFSKAHSLTVDSSGNVYVTGGSYGDGSSNYGTIKYDANGNELWVRSYIGGAENDFGEDIAYSLAIDSSGNVYVTGVSENDYTTIKYSTDGNELWVKRYNGSDNSSDVATSLAVDAKGNVYVTGGSNGDYATIKYGTDGNELWVKRYSGSENSYDRAASMVVDAKGNVYVTGNSATIKYDADGNEAWVRSSGGNSLAVDAEGNVYVTGWKDGDYATTKYDPNGNELWVKRYNGPGNGIDIATSLAIDGFGNIYVTGRSEGSGTGSDYATIKYSQNQAATVSSFTLIDADSDKNIRELKDGDTINLAALATLNLNIRANTAPAAIGSVVFNLSGAEMRTHTENIVPYALFADDNKGDYYGWTPKNGNYTLTATPYSSAKGKGEKGTPLTIHFTVTGTAISSLILVNAETDTDIKTLRNGDVIDLSTLPTSKLNIRAIAHPDTVGSVVFNLNNRLIVRENLAPYAIGGDIKGDYRAWTLPTGHHSLTATPYAGKYGRGKKGVAHKVTFTVVDMSATTRALNAEKPITDAAQNSEQDLSATPNPFSGQTTIRFSVPKSGYATVGVCDMRGVMLERLYAAQAEAGKMYSVPFSNKQLPGGVYMLRVVTGNHVRSYKLVLIR